MIARKSALIVATEILDAILAYIALFFITRYMEPREYGIVAFALGFVALFTIFGKFGFNHAHVKRVSEGRDIGRCNGTFFTIKIGLVSLMTILTLSVIFFWKFVMGRGFESSTHEIAIYIMLGYQIIILFAQCFTSTFNAKKEIAKARLPLFFEVVVRVVITIYVAIGGFGALYLALTYVAGGIIHFLSSLYFFWGYPLKKPNRSYFNDYSKFAYPLIIVVACSIIMTNIDKVLIQLFWSASDVGYYFAAFRLSRFINMFTIAIGMLLFPTYSKLHSKNDINGIRKLTFRSERYLSMIVFPMVFGIVILAEPATFILLSGWMPTVPLLQMLPFFTIFAALERPYQSQLMGMNRPKLARNRVVIMVILNILFNIILIPKDIKILGLELFGLGAKGAAIATVIAYSVGLIYSRFVALRLTGIKGNPRILLHLFAALLMAIMLYWLNNVVLISRWYHLLGFALLGLGVYLLILYFLKEFSKEDFYFFFDTLNIKKMIRYIKNEIKK